MHKDISSRAVREAAERRAKKVEFYQNGKPYAPKLTVSLIPGKDFHTFEQLCQFLTEKSQLLNGVQYIFTTNGRRVITLDELEHGQAYVISGRKVLEPYPYGLVKRTAPRMPRISNRYKFVREDDLRLLRPLSSKFNNVYANANQVNCALQNTPDHRVVTVVNNQNHAITSKVILNLRTPKSFENLLSDLGQTVRINVPKRMFTSSGLEVKSVSHLKHDLAHVDLFYIDSNASNEHLKLIKFPSLDSIDKFMERSVQRLTQISSHSSNIDLRPHNVAFGSSLSNSESAKQWKISNDVSTYSIPTLPRNKSNFSMSKVSASPQMSANKPKSVHSKALNRSEKDLRKRSTSRSRERIVPIEAEPQHIFSIDSVSQSKYEQIQNYAERMLQETSNQIKNERLLERAPLQNKPTIVVPEISTSTMPNKVGEINKKVSPSTKPTLRIPNGEMYFLNGELDKKESAGVEIPKRAKVDLPEPIEPVMEPPILKKTIKTQHKLNAPPPSNTTANTNKTPTKQSPAIVSETKATSSHTIAAVSVPVSDHKANTNLTGKNVRKDVTNTSSNPNPQQTEVKTIASQKVNATKSEKYLHKGSNVPTQCLELSRIFGYSGNKHKNLFCLSTGELAFTSGVVAILWEPQSNTQRFYHEHDGDIYCMRVDSKSQFIASCQIVSKSKTSIIRVWSVKSLSTVAILKDKTLNNKIIDMEFTVNKSLFVVNSESKLTISLWNWNTNKLISSVSKSLEKDEIVFGGTVHPLECDIMVTYGKMHLVVWHLQKDKSIDHRTALQTHSKISKTVYCADFLGDNSLLTGDFDGNLTIWAPFEVNNVLEFAIKEVKGHETQLICLKLTSDQILISGDKEGTLKTWDVSDGEFRLLNAIKLPSLSGAVCSIALQSEDNHELDIFVGTTENLILKGSALQSTSYEIVFEGHIMAIRTISMDPVEDTFYTASLDQKVCKWNQHALVWRCHIDIQAISSAVHPSGQILAIGSVNGIISIIGCASGEIIQHLEICSVCIGCMSYSADGNFLVAGCQDGNLHVLPVSDNGHSYSKVSILKGPLPILTLQWSLDTQFILTSVDDNNYQELILWDLHNTRYIRNVTNFSDNLHWFNPTCSGLEDARGTWDNRSFQDVINICNYYSPSMKYILTGDENGYVRLFSYPCYNTDAAFFQYQQGGGSVTDIKVSPTEKFVVACNFEGSILLWNLKPFDNSAQNRNPIT